MKVDGAWNNYEGLPRDYANRMDQILSRDGGYDVNLSGKQDWGEGSHTLNVRLGSWAKQVRFPYDMNKTGGWRYDYAEVCRSNGTVIQGNRSAHQADWNILEQTIDWIRSRGDDGASGKPFFVYQGMNIVHPPYVTNEFWYNHIDPNKIEVPDWPNLEDMHPCDLQSSMLKGCIPSNEERITVEDYYRKRNVRRIYYAMIAEFDAMVGRYKDAVREAGLWKNTIFIITSDHGDMQMEHRQTFKMTPYDASSSVPMVIYDPRRAKHPVVVSKPTQLIDIFPTILEFGGIEQSKWPSGIQGQSLLPLIDHGEYGRLTSTGGEWNRTFVISQFHGMNIAMSWFLIVKEMPSTDNDNSGHVYKLVRYGTGKEVPSQLFDLTVDPNEMSNLALEPSYADIAEELDSDLRTIVDYSAVARGVASYEKRSFRSWASNVTGDWRQVIHAKNLRWTPSWDRDSEGAFDAIYEWLSRPDDDIVPCRSETKWPISSNMGPGSSIKL